MTLAASFQIEYLQYLGADGRPVRELPVALRDPAALVPAFRRMLFARAFDAKAVALQRTGKLGTYPPCLGHEATHIGIGAAMRAGDVFAPSYREVGTMFERGVRPRDVLLYWGGDERGSDYPRDSDAAIDFPICVPIATQCLHAAGAALAFKLRGQPHVAVAACGDGGSSKSDFYAALNSAGAYDLPLVLAVINNGWAISVPREAQTGAQTLAQKGIAGGLHCLQVDGNDLVAVLESMRLAIERARAGRGGTVIEFMTYRLSDHTTADDARRYRDDAQVKAAWEREPIARLRAWLTTQGAWSAEEEAAWKAECERLIGIEVDAYLATPSQPVEAMFDHLYADPPPDVLAQRAAAIALEAGHG
ncbi:pyruvate dehydrogenase (acetyl-transferring) E1 component subunit alpha [Pseudoxanthomonas broegbernensis]|uniref:Pyruvate dehydrogenase E1 component subunit alpha n=1 Tax=Pseudoxanthomonas broegbernensis TaxID=83619 RepID=A0A7V8K7C0_9GAMM|nr:pyruvate dehydrogenase (acetyl-transferring) E1 component subunit alpha [Pseudoxanthomonas broegbernensis]KAF1686690.1 pyruvate dehydrogenase (acetyl-transferring) E1 component subunit alpha [Pseudoxanthomonas broegbernensis]MBB6063550.1 pyruvate dehydrogenase E1 component alpha subunit [Pseudoxanthomonas broegbernensis]